MGVRDEQRDRGLGAFTVLDWVGTLVAAVLTTGLAALPVMGFAGIFRDLGSPDALPLWTRIVITPWVPPALALVPALALARGLLGRQSLVRRRAWVVASFVTGVVGFCACLFALYLPIVSLAGRIKAD